MRIGWPEIFISAAVLVGDQAAATGEWHMWGSAIALGVLSLHSAVQRADETVGHIGEKHD